MNVVCANLTEIQRAIRDHFQHGGSTTAVLMVLATIFCILIGAVVASRLQEWFFGTGRRDDPQRLYQDLLRRLKLTTRHRTILQRMGEDRVLRHPTIILLSPTLYQRHADRWRASASAARRDVAPPTENELKAIKKALFPSG